MCGIAGVIGKLEAGNREAVQRMSAAMVHRGPDAEGSWESSPDEGGRGAMLAAPPAVHPRPVAGRSAAHGRPGHRRRHRLQWGDLQLRRPAEAAGGGGAGVRLDGRHRGPCCAHWPFTGPRRSAGCAGCSPSPSGTPARRRLLLARDPLGIKPLYLARNRDPASGLVHGLRLGGARASGLRPARRPHRLDPGAVGLGGLERIRGRARHGGPGGDRPGRGRGGCSRFDADGREVRSEELLAHPGGARSTSGMDEDGLAAVLEEGLGLHLASDVPAGGLPLRRRRLVGHGQPGPARRPSARSTPSPWRSRSRSSTRGRSPGRIAAAIGTQHREVRADGGPLRRASRGGPGQPGPADLRRSELVLHVARHPRRPASRWRWQGRAATSSSAATPPSGTCRCCTVGRGLRLGARGHCWWPRRALGNRAAAAGRRRHPAPDPLGQAPGDGPARRRSAGALPAGLRALPPGLPARAAGAGRRGRAGGRPASRHARAAGRGDAGPLTALGHQRPGAAALPRRAAAARQRRGEHGGLAGAAGAAGRPGPLRDRRPPAGRAALPAASGKKAMLRRIGLRGLDPALFDRPKSGFVLPFDRWIRARAAEGDGPDPCAIRRPSQAVGLEPGCGAAALAGVPRRGARACTGRGSGPSTSSSDGATGTGSTVTVRAPRTPVPAGFLAAAMSGVWRPRLDRVAILSGALIVAGAATS